MQLSKTNRITDVLLIREYKLKKIGHELIKLAVTNSDYIDVEIDVDICMYICVCMYIHMWNKRRCTLY